MKDGIIIVESIKKAIKGGLEWGYGDWAFLREAFRDKDDSGNSYGMITVNFIIFSHDFAKAFWGEKQITTGFKYTIKMKAWEYHLSEMVLEEDPLEYIEQFLEIEENDQD